MPLGMNRTGDFRKGTPVNTSTHDFGNPVTLPKNSGTPVTTPIAVGNTVSWAPDPSHFGNSITDGS